MADENNDTGQKTGQVELKKEQTQQGSDGQNKQQGDDAGGKDQQQQDQFDDKEQGENSDKFKTQQ